MQAFKHVLERVISLVLVCMLSAMVALTFADVLGRRLFNSPIFGANDMTEHLMAIIIFSGLPLLTVQRAHLSIDLFDAWLLRPGWRVWHKVVDALVAAVLLLVSYEYFVAMGEARLINEVSAALMIPRSWMYAFISATTLVSAFLALQTKTPQGHRAEGDAS
jgi:TRAP-type transport system small permease protein